MMTTTLLTILAPAIALLALGLVKLILDRAQNK